MTNGKTNHWREVSPEIFQLANIGTWEMAVSPDGAKMGFSPFACDLFGYDKDELGNDWDVFLEKACHPDYRDSVKAMITEAVSNPEKTFHDEFPVWSKKSGYWRWVYIFGKATPKDSPGAATVLGGVQDIHDHRAKQKRLERQQQEALQTIELQKAVLEQQIHEKTTLLRDIQARVDSILGATSPVTTDKPAPYTETGDIYDDVDMLFAEDLHKAFDIITEKMAWYKAVIDSIPFPISVTDLENRWMYLNAPGLAIAGAKTLEEVFALPAQNWSSQGEKTGSNDKGHDLFTFQSQKNGRFFQGQSSSLIDSLGATVGHIETMQDVTEVHKADERTRLMLDAMPLGCNFWDKDGNNIDCNEAVASLFSLPDKQTYLREFFRLSPERQPCGNKSLDLAKKYVAQAFETGRCRFEWIHQKLSGELIHSEITLVRISWHGEPVVIGYTNDLRELTAARNELDKERLLLKEVLDSSPVCMMILVRDKVRFVTTHTREFLGIDVGAGINDFHTTASELSALLSELRAKRRLNWRPISLRQATGAPCEMLANAFFTEYYGEEGLILWLVDVTAMRKKERELILARDAAEESTRAKSAFLANMSHEIRTPMNAILGMTHLILRTDLTDQQRDYMEKAAQSGKALLRIINDILDFSKIEAGKLEMEKAPFSIEMIMREVAAIEDETAKAKGLEIKLALPEDLPETIMGDPSRLRQVLLNLMSNAVKFTNKGGVTMSVTALEREAASVTLDFSVADTGIGMAQRQIAKLFSPFTQADTSITREYGGTGLGLAICRSIIELMGGAIWCESVLGEGSNFRFTVSFDLPEDNQAPEQKSDKGIAIPPAPNQGEENAEKLAAALAPLRGAKLLLVEDNPINQMVAEELLKIPGFMVDKAANGQEALARLLENNYALILMDIQMPVMDGFAAARAIREDARHASLPIIAMTALAMREDREKSLGAGMNDHITKPIDAVDLYTALARWLLPPASPVSDQTLPGVLCNAPDRSQKSRNEHHEQRNGDD